MKKKKIIIPIVIVLAIALIVALGYFTMLKIEKIKVESAIEEMFSNLKSSEDNEEKAAVIEEIKDNTEGEDTEDKIDYTVLFSKVDYSIVKDEVNFKEATVILDITNKNMKTVLGKYLVKVFQLAFANAFTSTYTDEELNEQLASYLKEQIESDEIENVTNQVTLKMEKQDGKWTVKEESREEFINAVLPGFSDAINEISDSFNGISE